MSSRRRAFTLVEMAVAIAILAFVLVSLGGLLSVGLSTQKSSIENTRVAAVAEYVIAMEGLNSYAAVSAAGYSTNYYFDIYGNTNSPAASYLKCTVSNIGSYGNNGTFLGSNTNVAPMKMTLVYPLPAPANTNVFYYNRSND